jgi:hypothetical protein
MIFRGAFLTQRRKGATLRPCALALICHAVLGGLGSMASQELKIGIIDFYGLGRVTEGEARQALAFREGDTITLAGDERPGVLAESERRLSTLSGVARAHINLTCCESGRGIIYVGIEEKGRAATHFHAAPTGSVRLAADVVQAGREFSEALKAAVLRGDAGEDDFQGHALFHDPATRAIQERFIVYAARDLNALRRVLRESSDTEHRALAAQILGYVGNKQKVVGDLVYGMRDSSEEVRNNAMRALAVFAAPAARATGVVLRVPFEPFIGLLNSPVWTDRNKAALALMGLTERRDSMLLAKLRNKAIVPLVEMARWKNEGHAMPALKILGRIAGESDETTQTAWTRGEREAIIGAALKRH